jgi:hypothetical protein
MNWKESKILAFSKKALQIIGYLLAYAALTIVGALATAKLIDIFKTPQSYQLIFPENAYNVFQDIFSDIDDLRSTIKSAGINPQNSEINNKVNSLEQTVTKIAETVMDNPDQAITAKLLQNDQGALKDRIINLENGVALLNARIDTLYTALISISIGLLGAAGVIAGILKIWHRPRGHKSIPS